MKKKRRKKKVLLCPLLSLEQLLTLNSWKSDLNLNIY